MKADALETLNTYGGKMTDRELGERMGCSEGRARQLRADANIPGYRGRSDWTRRDWLLNSAAGLDIPLALCRE